MSIGLRGLKWYEIYYDSFPWLREGGFPPFLTDGKTEGIERLLFLVSTLSVILDCGVPPFPV